MTDIKDKSNKLSVGCVVFDTHPEVLADTITSLKTAIDFATTQGVLSHYSFTLINNQNYVSETFERSAQLASDLFANIEIVSGHGNIGYGRANNLAIEKADSRYHLILNPDVKLEKTALAEGLSYLNNHPDVGLVTPHAVNERGEFEYLSKRPPTALIILLRGLNINLLNRIFQRTLDWYTYKDQLPTTNPIPIELASGCFMLCRTEELKAIGGFSPKYFLYFEDFDLSRRITKKIFLPSMKITHLGGNTVKKGWRHIKLFLASYLIFLKG